MVIAPKSPPYTISKMQPSQQPWGRFFNEYRYEVPNLIPEEATKAAQSVYQKMKKEGFQGKKGTEGTDAWVEWKANLRIQDRRQTEHTILMSANEAAVAVQPTTELQQTSSAESPSEPSSSPMESNDDLPEFLRSAFNTYLPQAFDDSDQEMVMVIRKSAMLRKHYRQVKQLVLHCAALSSRKIQDPFAADLKRWEADEQALIRIIRDLAEWFPWQSQSQVKLHAYLG